MAARALTFNTVAVHNVTSARAGCKANFRVAAPAASHTSSAKLGFSNSTLLGNSRIQAITASPRTVSYSTKIAASLSTGALKITVQGKHLEVTDAIKDHAEEKIGHALQPFEESTAIREVDVKFSARGGEKTLGPKAQKVEVTVYTARGVFRVEDQEENLYASIDKVADKLSRKMRKTKERTTKKGRASAKELVMEGIVEPTETTGRVPDLPEEVIRTKYFDMKPISVSDAIENLEMVGHDFYTFQNAETGCINVVYQRKEGGFGLIVPRPEE